MIRAHRRRLVPADQPLHHLKRQIGQPQQAANVAFCQSNGLSQFLDLSELTGLQASPPPPCSVN
jgi:hypothetical protein